MTETEDQFFDTAALRSLVQKWAVDCGDRIQSRRSLLGFDRKGFAKILGTTEATVYRIETGTINPRDHIRLAIAASLQVEVETLWPYPRRAEVYAAAGAA